MCIWDTIVVILIENILIAPSFLVASCSSLLQTTLSFFSPLKMTLYFLVSYVSGITQYVYCFVHHSSGRIWLCVWQLNNFFAARQSPLLVMPTVCFPVPLLMQAWLVSTMGKAAMNYSPASLCVDIHFFFIEDFGV